MVKNKILKYLKNKKGAVEVIHSAILTLCVITVFVFFIDIIFFTRSYIAMSNYVDGIARTISIQGGVQNSPPSNFPGGANFYFDINEIRQNTITMLNKYKINENTATMFIQGTQYTATGAKKNQHLLIMNNNSQFKPSDVSTVVTNLSIDYGQIITTSLQYKFRWTLTGATTNINLHRTAISEFKHADNTWLEI